VAESRQDFIALATAVARAHQRLFPEDVWKEPRTLQVIALALTDLVPIHWADTKAVLTEPELLAARFTASGMEGLVVSRRRFEAALPCMQAASLEQARASLTLRQSPRLRR
jgi:hypothetical protein